MKTPLETIDWHWGDPLWPRQRMHPVVVGWLAKKLTLYRCMHCGKEIADLNAFARLLAHFRQWHPGRPVIYTAYPIMLRERVSGYDS